MANFNLNDYETVESRIARFYKDYPDGRIITKNVTTAQDRTVSTWVVKTTIYLTDADQERKLPKATGYAFEIDGVGMANKTSALENAETSSTGRALANAGYSGNKRASREEMAKVERAVEPQAPTRPWLVEAEDLAAKKDLPGLRELYSNAVRTKVSAPIIEKIKEIASLAS
jgi:Zn-finger domain-containing protein